MEAFPGVCQTPWFGLAEGSVECDKTSRAFRRSTSYIDFREWG